MFREFCIFVVVCAMAICAAIVAPAVQNLSSAKADAMRIEAIDRQAADQLQRQQRLIEWSERRAKEKDIDEQLQIALPWTLIGCFSTIFLVIVSVFVVQYTRIRTYRSEAIVHQSGRWID